MRTAPLLWLTACATVALAAALMRPERNPMPPAAPAATWLAQAVPEPSPAPPLPAAILDDAQWRNLQRQLAQHPARDAELARIVSLLAFQADVRALADPQAADRSARAARVATALPAHLAAREVTLGEARAIHQVLRSELGQAAGPEPAASAADPRDRAYLTAQQAAVARWRALPEAQRSQQALLSELDALRHHHYPESPP